MSRSTCFGHYYAHLQELETINMVTACGTKHCKCGDRIIQFSQSFPPLISVSPPFTVFRVTCCKYLYSLELLMMGIIVPETCWPDYKFNKPLCASSCLFFPHINLISVLRTRLWNEGKFRSEQIGQKFLNSPVSDFEQENYVGKSKNEICRLAGKIPQDLTSCTGLNWNVILCVSCISPHLKRADLSSEKKNCLNTLKRWSIDL
jgi:hypothetical protein